MIKNYTPHQMSTLCYQLSYLYGSGLSLTKGLSLLDSNQVFNYASWLKQLKDLNQLSSVLKEDQAFDSNFITAFKIAEEMGQEESFCKHMAQSYEKEAKLHDDLKESLSMPMLLFTLLLVIFAIISWSILPIFQDLILQFGNQQSLQFQLLLESLKVLSLISLLIWFSALLVLVFKALQHHNQASMHADVWTQILSLFPETLMLKECTQFSFLAQMLLSSGIHNQVALTLLPIPRSKQWREKMSLALTSISKDEGLYEIILSGHLYPKLQQSTLQLASVSGKLDEAMIKVGNEMVDLTQKSLQNTVYKIEPILIIGMTLLVFSILFIMIFPLFGIMSALG